MTIAILVFVILIWLTLARIYGLLSATLDALGQPERREDRR